MPGEHAKLSPSGAHRWMRCPGSVVLEDGLHDSSKYADEGTAAHEVAKFCLLDGTDALEYLGETIVISDDDGERRVKVDSEMVKHVQSYVDYVRDLAEGKTLLVEQKLSIEHATGESGGKGTSDAIIIDSAAKEITVVDLKYGMGVVVDAEENEQLLLYALAALREHEVVVDFDWITVVVYQPRAVGEPSTYRVNRAHMDDFLRGVLAAASRVALALQQPYADIRDDSISLREFLVPGEKQCRFCKAKASCPAIRAEVAEVLGSDPATAADFADLEAPGEEAGDNWLAVCMGRVDMVEQWCKAIRAEVERRLFLGQDVPGYKLVEGKLGNRAWADADEAEAKLKGMRLKLDEMYERKLISPTTAEKLLKKEKPKSWNALQPFIQRAPGKPSVAPVTDKRPALAVSATAADFAALDD